jgi:ketosteroid isomerase-like protein
VFLALVNGVADARWDDLPELYAERTHVVHPFDPRRAAPLLTRDDVRAHFGRVAGLRAAMRREPTNITIHETTDPEVIVAEFEYRSTIAGVVSVLPCIFVLRVRDGQIVESRDYVDHLSSARALGRLDDLMSALTPGS